MMKNPTILKLCGSITLFVLTTLVAPAAQDYLPFVGPPPLRFATIQLPIKAQTNTVTVSDQASESVKPLVQSHSNDTNIIMPTASMSSTNTLSITAASDTSKSPATGYKASLLTPDLPSSDADDLLNVNPGMLINYFKPLGGGIDKTRAEVYIPVDLEFTPPVTQPPVKSRATYKTE